MLFGVTLMSFMNIGAKLVKINTQHSVLKVAFIRSFIMSVGSYSHGRFIYGVDPFKMSKAMWKLMFWRSLFGTMAFLLEVTAIYLMPISLAIVLVYT